MKKIGQCLREKSTHRFRTKSFSLNDKKGEKHSFIYFTKPFYLLRIYMYHSSTFILSLPFSLCLCLYLWPLSLRKAVLRTQSVWMNWNVKSAVMKRKSIFYFHIINPTAFIKLLNVWKKRTWTCRSISSWDNHF